MMAESDSVGDVPGRTDFRRAMDAEQWAATAMAKRPWRGNFFRSLIAECARLPTLARILELGSGPGFVARAILEACPRVEYTALDLSAAMHDLAKARLGSFARRVRFVEADFKMPDWTYHLSSYDAVVTMQAVHELRHKRHAVTVYKAVVQLLAPGGIFLACDHVCGAGGMGNAALYMSLPEHQCALRMAGFSLVQ